MIIKKATKEDSDLLVYFIKKLAKAEDLPYEVTVTSRDI